MKKILLRPVDIVENNILATLKFFNFLFDTARYLVPPYPRAIFFYQQFILVGVKSIPIVLVVGSFVGMVLAVMTYKQFSTLNIESLIGPFVAQPMVSQLGPILTALIFLCRVGSAMTAELGTMRVTEQIDALFCFGINPMRTLIIPRVTMCSILLPALTVISDSIGIVGGWFLSIHVYGVNEHYYLEKTHEYLDAYDIYVGLIKGFFFGLIISSICCYKGYHCDRGATGVGKAIMQAVVISFIVIIVSNFFISLLSNAIWYRFLA